MGESKYPPPSAPTNWNVEVVADSPLIYAPSVVCCSPDGRIFMGEDADDMQSPSDATEDRIVSIYPDGQVLTFATNLHAVFGLQYIDGKVYVHHTPKFSVFQDFHGIGINRVDLITNDNPHPWLPNINDHIPSGIRLAMDGYLYFTTGDKGIKGAVGVDGRKIEMRGGIFRMRPDGTGLEIYCTGTRNFLEPAINSEDEIFTYDNTDDGGGWWKRVTHMVDGGYYGYPYDFKPQRPYTLWRMDEYGAGAPSGACAYNEDALPDEYKGNLFLCDWGGEILRLRVAREGSTYKILEKIRFMVRSETNDLHPVGICVGPDGKSLYVTDWGKSYWKRNEKMGRLLKITYTGKTQETPKPDWFVPAATGEEFHATTADLLRGLTHPAQSVRMVAQRRLAERGHAAARSLVKLLQDTKAASYARWSALWTLDAMDGGKKEDKAIIAALQDKDVTVEMQAARELGTRSVRKAAPALIALLHSTNAAVRFRASTALGRIGDSAAVPALMKELDQTNLFARYAAFLALRRIGMADPKAWPEIVDGFASPNAAIRQGTGFAVRETYDLGLVKALAAFSTRQDVPLSTRTNVFSLLSSLSQKQPPWNGDWWNSQPVSGTPAPKTAKWEGTPIVASALRTAIADRDVSIRKIGVDWVHASHDTNAAAELAVLFQHETDTSVRVSILKDISAMPGNQGAAIITSVLQDPRASIDLLAAAIESAGKIPGNQWNSDLITMAQTSKQERVLMALFDFFGAKVLPGTVPLLTAQLSQTNSALRQHAMDALKAIGGLAAAEGLIACLESPDLDTRRQAIAALGGMKAKAAIPPLIKIAPAADTHDAVVEALAKIANVAALDIYLDGLASRNTVLRGQCEMALRAIQQAALPLIEDRLATNDFPAAAKNSLKQIYVNDAAAKKNPIFRHKILEITPDQFQEFALAHSGDAWRGKALFNDRKGIGCIRCHRIEREGGDIGPDLTDIRAKYSRASIIESVLYPSKQILEGYQQVFFETQGDEEVSGIVRSETPDEVTIIDSGAAQHVLKKSDIKSRKVSQISLMPEGLEAGLTLTEFSDLISYVENPEFAKRTNQPAAPTHMVRIPQQPPPPNLTAAEAVPEPGADLFSFLDVSPDPPPPDHHVPPAPQQTSATTGSSTNTLTRPLPRPHPRQFEKPLHQPLPPRPPGSNPPPATPPE